MRIEHDVIACRWKKPKVTAAKGNSFNSVVTTATRPELPRLLIQVTIQIRLMAKAPASRLSCPKAGMNTCI